MGLFNNNKSTLVYNEISDTLRQMPENFLIAYVDDFKSRRWVCEPDLAANKELCIKVFTVLLTYENKFQPNGNVLLQTIINS